MSKVVLSFKQRIFVYALFLLCPVLALAQRFRTIVPYTNEQGKLMTEVVVNGHKARFLIDTGAPCCISHSFAQKIGLLQAGQQQRFTDSNGQQLSTTLVTLDSLRLGQVNFQRIQAVRWEPGNMAEMYGVDGIVGYNLLRMGVVLFDGRGQRMGFASVDRAPMLDSTYALPLVADPFLTIVPLHLGGGVMDTAMFDSGSLDFYEMSMQRYARLSGDTTHVKHLGTGHGILSFGAAGVEQASVKHRLKVPMLTLGASRFANVATITTAGEQSRLGTEVLHFGDVAIDYPRGRFYFIPHDPLATPNLYNEEWEVVITVTENVLTAGVVWNEQLPIRSGDRITAINGQRFDTVDPYEATARGLIQMPGNKAQITFRPAGSQQEQTITIRRY